jgi:DNA-3-methyladenine glycosylase
MEQEFFAADSAQAARNLLGCQLVHAAAESTLRGRIVETEAYYGSQDPASHAFNGRTERNRVMFGPAGTAYVYVCYGVHRMLNVTTQEDGVPGAVLLRAVEPVDGIQHMQDNRGVDDAKQLCNGPGKLCEAFGVTTEHTGRDLTAGHLRIEYGATPDKVVKTPRIGISQGQDMELRYYERGNPHASR